MKKLTIFVEDLPNNTNIATQVGYNAKKLGQYLTNDQLTTRPIPIPEEHTCCNCGKSFSYTNKEYEKMQTSLDCSVSRENASLTDVSVL